MFRLAVFVSGGGTNLQALIDRIADNSLRDIEICCVIASKYHTGAQ
jgi:phosphoribosylglycinamide formyltransferase-1